MRAITLAILILIVGLSCSNSSKSGNEARSFAIKKLSDAITDSRRFEITCVFEGSDGLTRFGPFVTNSTELSERMKEVLPSLDAATTNIVPHAVPLSEYVEIHVVSVDPSRDQRVRFLSPKRFAFRPDEAYVCDLDNSDIWDAVKRIASSEEGLKW